MGWKRLRSTSAALGAGLRSGYTLLALGGLFAAALLSGSAASNAVFEALQACGRTIIPSLFPFAVLAGILSSAPAASALSSLAGSITGTLFGLSPECACAILLGSTAGFPIGARTTVELYKNGLCTRDEAERMLPYTNNASAAFLICVVGESMLGDRLAGIALAIAQLGSALLIGSALGRGHRRKAQSKLRSYPISHPSLPSIIVSAISSAAQSMLNVCACVCIFAALCALLPPQLSIILELSEGAAFAARYFKQSPGFAMACSGFVSGFAGLSVHMQVMSFILPAGLSPRRFIAGKCVQSVLCAFLAPAIYFLLSSL